MPVVEKLIKIINRMMEKIEEIKAFSQETYLFVSRLIKQLSPNCELSEEAFRAIVESSNAHLFVMYDANGTPVSMLTVGLYRTPTGYKAWIEDVVADETCRGCGYGQKIVEFAIRYLRDAGVNTLSLTSNPSRIAANRLYQKLGFELYETNFYKMRFAR